MGTADAGSAEGFAVEQTKARSTKTIGLSVQTVRQQVSRVVCGVLSAMVTAGYSTGSEMRPALTLRELLRRNRGVRLRKDAGKRKRRGIETPRLRYIGVN
jgi:hypothetical protein